VVSIDDEEVAKAGGDEVNGFWWAWILVIAAALAGVVAYAKKKADEKIK
jgi:hypothetical protein